MSARSMSARSALLILFSLVFFSAHATASTTRKDLMQFDDDQKSLNPWVHKNNSSIKNWLCIDQIDEIRYALKLLSQSPICRKTPSLDKNFSNSGVSSISEIVKATLNAPASQAEFKTVEASRYKIKSSFASAFLPTLELTNSSIKRSDAQEKISSKITSYPPIIDSTTGYANKPNWSYTETNSLIDPQYYASFALTIPIYKPYNIQYYAYYKSSDKASAFSSTASIDSQIKTSLQDAISLWVAYKQINMNQLNVIAAFESLVSTVGQYKIGSLAKPDVAESLSTLRSYQSSLASEYETYLSLFNSLSSQLGSQPSNFKINKDFFKVNFLDPLLNYERSLDSETLQTSIKNNNSIYNYLYLSSSYLDLGKSYLANYLPEISLSLGYSYTSDNESIKTRNCTSNWNCVLTSKENQITSTADPSISLNMTWTLFDSGSSYYQYKSNKKTAKSNFDLAVNTAYEAIESITTDFQKKSLLKDEIDFNYSSLSASIISYRETLVAYRAGFSDTTSLVQRLTSLVSARSSYLSSIKDQLENKIDIMASLRDGIYSDLNYFGLDYNQDLTEKLNVITN